jgi:3-methylcrotonyl-CoA carboxylase alpha subunit
MITGLDLVEWQLRVAAGEPLPLSQQDLAINGHAIEARIYAENPEKGFLPSIGTLRHLRTPHAVTFTVGAHGAAGQPAAVRIDSGVRGGDTISPFYDPMIAKLIVWAPDREQALARMTQALSEYQIVGLATNIAFLKRLIASKPFATADLDTGLIERNHATLFPPAAEVSTSVLALASASLVLSEKEKLKLERSGDPWADASGWRMNSVLQRTFRFSDQLSETAAPIDVMVTYLKSDTHLTHGGRTLTLSVREHKAHDLTLTLGDKTIHGTAVRDGEVFHVFTADGHAALAYNDPLMHAGQSEADGGRLTAPMPGKIVAVLAQAGARLEKGAPILVMEAMKMEHTITAPSKGIVEQHLYAVGDQVAEGAQLLSFEVVE